MPNARQSRRSPLRPPVVLALFLASALFAAAALAFTRENVRAAAVAAAASCPAEPPSPLRTLYQASERIAVARVGESFAVEGEGKENLRKTAFVATESIKGDPGEKSFFVFHPVWPDNANYAGNFREGETLLLFLSHAAEGELPGGYYVTDIRHGAKRLSADDLKIYLKRIEELQWVMRQEPADRDELLEWLVRCAEEPATRWEGAYELAVSYQLASYEAEAAREKARAAARISNLPTEAGAVKAEGEGNDKAEGEDAEETAAGASGSPGDAVEQTGVGAAGASEESPVTVMESWEVSSISPEASLIAGGDIDSKLVKRLTAAQKERLAGAAYGAEKIGEGEIQLIYVVENWDGARLAPFVIRHLQKIQDDPPFEAEQLVHTLARVLKDDRLARLAQKYSEKTPYSDDDVRSAEEAAAESEGAESEDEDSADAELVVSEGAAEAAQETEQAEDSAEAEEIMAGALDVPDGAAKPTASKVRARMLHNFLAAVEKTLNAAGAETAQR